MSQTRVDGTRPSLSVSQNFLTSAGLIDRLLRPTGLGAGDLVLEIGPGKGHITRALLARGCAVRATELDPVLFERLQNSLGGRKGLTLVRGDFLRQPLPRAPYQVFANIPFNRTTDILRKLTEAAHPPEQAWLVVEKGAAKRFLGQPRETLSSLRLKPYFTAEIAFTFRREDFHPAPSVDAVLLHLRRKAEPDLPPADRAAFAAFVEQGHRYGLRRLLTKRQIATALRLEGLPSIEPSAEIRYVQWLCLFRCHQRFHA